MRTLNLLVKLGGFGAVPVLVAVWWVGVVEEVMRQAFSDGIWLGLVVFGGYAMVLTVMRMAGCN